MNRNNIEFVENEAFEKHVNIKLCNALINFIAETSNNNPNDVLRNIEQKCIWFDKEDTSDIQEICEIQYFGELLERYEHKLEANICNIRAISLALGYAKELVTENMITGTQVVDFINKIKKLANNDIYLKGALYLYDNKKYYQYEKELLEKKYDSTEDIFFVLSLFDNTEECFKTLKSQVINLLGENKTISAINNIKLYGWLISRLYDLIKKDRKKDIAILKMLVLVPTKQIKGGDNAFRILSENGYSREEIAYLNYGLLFYAQIPNVVRIGNSITEERIAINFCKEILNSSNQQHKAIYYLIKKMIAEYRTFNIKCGGNESLKQAVISEINIIDPITFLEFYEIFNNEIFSFNVLEEKWDILAKEMNKKVYEELFDNFIQKNNFDKKELEKCIERYNKLTNDLYLDTFYLFDYRRKEIFEKLVNKDIISLKEYYKAYKDKGNQENISIKHLKEYVNKIHYRNAFLFLEYIIEDEKYSIENINEFEFDLRSLYNSSQYSYGKQYGLNIENSFLSQDEKEKLFFWIDNYMFKVFPNDYIEFAKSVLKSDSVKAIISKEILRDVYFTLIEIDENLEKNKELRNEYLTPEELENITNKENEEQEKQKIEEFKQMQEKITKQFEELPKERVKELNNFCFKYRWNDLEWKVCSEIIKNYIDKNIENFKFCKDEIFELMSLFETLMNKKIINIKDFKGYILRYMESEEIEDGIIKRAC